MHKTVLAALVAASLAAACSSDGTDPADPTAPGADPITGLPAADAPDPAADAGPSAAPAADASRDPVAGADPAGAVADAPDAATDGNAITAANYEAIVGTAFGIYTGAKYGATVLAFPGTGELLSMPEEVDAAEGSRSREDVCVNGGTARYAVEWRGSRVVSFDRRGAWDGCQIGSLVIDGELEHRSTDTVAIASSGVAARWDITDVAFSGGVGYGAGNNYGGAYGHWWTASELDFEIETEGLAYRIEGATTEFSLDPAARTLRGGFAFSDAASAGRSIAASTPVPLTGPTFAPEGGVPTFEAGVLRLDGGDGSSVTIDAANGDAASARVTLVTAGGTDTFDKPWADWDRPLQFLPGPPRP